MINEELIEGSTIEVGSEDINLDEKDAEIFKSYTLHNASDDRIVERIISAEGRLDKLEAQVASLNESVKTINASLKEINSTLAYLQEEIDEIIKDISK